MIFLLALIPATALTIAGYFVLFLASRTEGGLRSFGRYLGFWAFTLAGLVILAAIFAAAHFHGRFHPGMERMHAGMYGDCTCDYCPWMRGHPELAPPPGSPTPPAPPEK